MKKLLFVLILLPLIAIASDLNIQSLTRLHLSHHHSPKWTYFRGIDDEWMDNYEELRNFKINEKSDTVYIYYYDALNYSANVIIWNSENAIRLVDGILRHPWESEYTDTIDFFYRDMVENWDTTTMRTLAGKYDWRKLNYGICDSFPFEAYVSRIIIKNGKLTIDTIEYIDPTQNGELKEALDNWIENPHKPTDRARLRSRSRHQHSQPFIP